MPLSGESGSALLEQLGSLLAYVFVAFAALATSKIKEAYDAKKSRLATRRTISASIVLNTFLTETRLELDCDRVSVCQFHNGEHFASGASVQKVTLTHYVVRPGVSVPISTEGSVLSSTPATFMTSLLDRCFRDGYAIYKGFDADDPWIARYQAHNGLQTVATMLIPGPNREAFGLISFAWLDRYDIADAEIDMMKKFAKTCSAYL